jgi:SAM-dependent methyltransferase
MRLALPHRRGTWLRTVPTLLVWLVGVSCVSTMREYHGHTVFNPLFLPYLESSARDCWQMPDDVIRALDIAAGQTIADIGAGGGYFTERFARVIGPGGRVYATDVQDVMIRKLQRRAEKRQLANVTVVHGTFEDPCLPAGSCDLAFFSSVYKEIDQRVDYMQKIRSALKPEGRVAILEYRLDADAPGPPRDRRLAEATVIAEMQAAGFIPIQSFDFLPREYFLVFRGRSADAHSTDSHGTETPRRPDLDPQGHSPTP